MNKYLYFGMKCLITFLLGLDVLVQFDELIQVLKRLHPTGPSG